MGEKDMDEKEKVKEEKNINEEEKLKNKNMEEKIEDKEKNEEETKFEKSKEKFKKQKEEMEKMCDKKIKNRKRIIITLVIFAIVIVIGLFVSTIFAFINIGNEKIINGISISGIDVSGLSKEEAKQKIEEIYIPKKEKEIKLKYNEYETTISPILMEVDYKIEQAIENAYNVGKNSNIFISNYEILFALINKKDIALEMSLNEEVTKQTIEDMNINLPDVVIESSYSIEEDELVITKGKSGIKIDTDQLLKLIKERLNNKEQNEDAINIPIINKEPDPIDIEKIHEEIYKEPQDAYIVKEPFEVHPEVEGIDFDVEAAKEILKEDKEEYIIPLIIKKPETTLEDLGDEAFPSQLSTFTTRYDVSDVDRTTNLKLACKKINGTVLLAGETFSYNNVVGKRTVAAGYKNAKIYEAGQVVDGLGGGICQISSTLYNAALLANMDIVERRNHQFVTSYVEAGRDATVVYGSTDFKFKNTRKYPVKITATVNAGIATISIYGIKEENEYTFKFSKKDVRTIPYTTQYIDDNTLPQGTEVVKQKGTSGLIRETYITKLLNGKVVSTELLSRDTYNPMTRIVRRGTKKVETPAEETKNEEEITKPQENVIENEKPVEVEEDNVVEKPAA